MEINGPPPFQLPLGKAPAPISAWRIGQLLQAVVVQQISVQTALLQINNQRVYAETSYPLSPGQRLEVEVTSLGTKPVLKVLTPAPSEPAINGALKQALPRQAGLSALIANIVMLASQPSNSGILASPVLSQIKSLFDHLPQKDRVGNGAGIKQAIKDSGLFLENKLRQTVGVSSPAKIATTPLERDLKTQMLRLMATIQKESIKTPAPKIIRIIPQPLNPTAAITAIPLAPKIRLLTAPPVSSTATATPTQTNQPLTATTVSVPPPPLPRGRPQPQGRVSASLGAISNTQLILKELGKQLEGSIARTQLQQIASLPTQEQPNTHLTFELPIRSDHQVDIFHLIIEDDKSSEENTKNIKRRWSITLAFDLEVLGPMYARLQLEDEKLSTTLWAEKTETSARVNQHLAELRQRYQTAGIDNTELRCFQGKPPENKTDAIPNVVLDINV